MASSSIRFDVANSNSVSAGEIVIRELNMRCLRRPLLTHRVAQSRDLVRNALFVRDDLVKGR